MISQEDRCGTASRVFVFQSVVVLLAMGPTTALSAATGAQTVLLPGQSRQAEPVSSDPKERFRRLFFEYTRLMESGDPDQVGKDLLEALRFYEQAGNLRGQAHCRFFLAMWETDRHNLKRARQHLEESLRRLEELNDPIGIWTVHLLSAQVEKKKGAHVKAEAILNQALDSVGAMRASEQILTLDSLQIYAQLCGVPIDFGSDQVSGFLKGPFGHALKWIIPSLFEVMTQLELADTLTAQGRTEEAESRLEAARGKSPLFFGLVDGEIWSRLGKLRRRQGRFDEAREAFQRALPLTPLRQPGLLPQVDLLRQLADVEVLSGRFDAALRAIDKALNQVRKLGSQGRRESLLLAEHARIEVAAGRYEEATETLVKVRDAGRSAQYPYAEAVALHELGWIAFLSGKYEEAVSRLTHAIQQFQNAKAPHGEVNARLLLGEVNDLLGRYDQTSQEMTRALALSRTIGFREAQSLSAMVLAFTQLRAGDQRGTRLPADPASSLEVVQPEALQWLSKAEWREIRTLIEIFLLGRTDEETLQRLTRQSLESHNLPLRALSLATHASLHSRQGSHDRAAPLWQQAEAAFQTSGQKDLGALAQFAHGASLWKLGDRDRGIEICKDAVENIENHVVSPIQRTDLLTAFLDGDHIQIYALLVEMLSQAGQPEAAFYYAEKARARAFLQMLGDQRFRIPDDVEPSLAARAEVLRSRIQRLELEAARYDELESARRAYRALIVQLKQSSSDYAHLIDVRPMDVDQVRRQALLPGTTLVSFFVGPQLNLAWVMDQESFNEVVLPPSAAERDEILAVSDLFANWRGENRGVRVTRYDHNPDASRALYSRLIAPLRPYLRNSNLVIVPHNRLHYLPFAALRDPDSGRYLIEDFVLSYVPSASIMPYLRPDRSPPGKTLVAGNPVSGLSPLPAAEKEAQTVAGLFEVQLLTGPKATESAIRSWAEKEKTGLLHLATHGIYDPQSPRSSHIVLAQDEHHDGYWDIGRSTKSSRI